MMPDRKKKTGSIGELIKVGPRNIKRGQVRLKQTPAQGAGFFRPWVGEFYVIGVGDFSVVITRL